MNPGVELDLLIAEHVMGWQWQEIPRHIHIIGHDAAKDELVLMPPNADFPAFNPITKGTLFYQAAVPAYSTDLESAWQVVKSLKDWNFYLEKEHDDHRWICILYKEGQDDHFEFSADGETPEPAICLAALKAVGYGKTQHSETSSS